MIYSLKRVLVIVALFSHSFGCFGMEPVGSVEKAPALYSMPSEMRHKVLQELVNSADTLPDAMKQIRKFVYLDPQFRTIFTTTGVSKILVMLAKRFNTRNYSELAREFQCNYYSRTVQLPLLLHKNQTLQSWSKGYEEFKDIFGQKDVTRAREFLSQAMPVDEIAFDIAESYDSAKRANDVVWKASALLRIGQVALLGPDYAQEISKALQFQSLSMACQSGDRDLIKKAIASTVDINYQDNDGCTALWNAVWGHREIAVEELLAAGADIDKQDKKGMSPLMEAVSCQEGPTLAIVNKLIRAGADLSLKNYKGKTALGLIEGLTVPLLHCRCSEHVRKNREEVVQILKSALSAKNTP